MSYSDLIRSDRTPGQRAQDDEDHRQALCGLSFDARERDEFQDFYSRHYDSQLFALSPPGREARGQGTLGGAPHPGVATSSGPTPPFLT